MSYEDLDDFSEDVDILLKINDKWRARALAAEAQVQEVREWTGRGMYPPDANRSDWQRGFITARAEIRAILDAEHD